MSIALFYNKIRRNDHSFIKDAILHNGMCFKCELVRTHWLLQPFPPHIWHNIFRTLPKNGDGWNHNRDDSPWDNLVWGWVILQSWVFYTDAISQKMFTQ